MEAYKDDLATDITKIVINAVDSENHDEGLIRLKRISDYPGFEASLCDVLMKLQGKYVRILSVPLDKDMCHSYCIFFAKVFLYFTCFHKRFLQITDCVLDSVTLWVCSRMGPTSIELQNIYTECLSIVLEIVGRKMAELYPSRLDCVLEIIQDDILADSIPRIIRSKLLNILLNHYTFLKASNNSSSRSPLCSSSSNMEKNLTSDYTLNLQEKDSIISTMISGLNLNISEDELTQRGITDELLTASGGELMAALRRTKFDAYLKLQVESYATGLQTGLKRMAEQNVMKDNIFDEHDSLEDTSVNHEKDRTKSEHVSQVLKTQHETFAKDNGPQLPYNPLGSSEHLSQLPKRENEMIRKDNSSPLPAKPASPSRHSCKVPKTEHGMSTSQLSNNSGGLDGRPIQLSKTENEKVNSSSNSVVSGEQMPKKKHETTVSKFQLPHSPASPKKYLSINKPLANNIIKSHLFSLDKKEKSKSQEIVKSDLEFLNKTKDCDLKSVSQSYDSLVASDTESRPELAVKSLAKIEFKPLGIPVKNVRKLDTLDSFDDFSYDSEESLSSEEDEAPSLASLSNISKTDEVAKETISCEGGQSVLSANVENVKKTSPERKQVKPKWPPYDQLCSLCGSTDHISKQCPGGLKSVLIW